MVAGAVIASVRIVALQQRIDICHDRAAWRLTPGHWRQFIMGINISLKETICVDGFLRS
jgi:hypothetical protein